MSDLLEEIKNLRRCIVDRNKEQDESSEKTISTMEQSSTDTIDAINLLSHKTEDLIELNTCEGEEVEGYSNEW